MENIRIKDGFTNEKIVICSQNILEQFENIPTIYNFYITDIGFFPCAKFHYRERQSGISEYILIFCIKGEGTVKFNDKVFIIEEGYIIIIPPNTPHVYYSNNNNPWDIFWVHFNGDYSQYFFKNYKFENKIQCNLDSFRNITLLFSNTINILEKGLTENNLVFASQSLCHMVSSILLNNTSFDSHVNSKLKYIDNAIIYMNHNLNKILTLDDISKAIGVSRSHTSLIFKEETGHSPVDFFTHLKIQNSCSFLKYSDTPIKEISSHFGYEDQYYFSRVFKKIMGTSPLQYRQENGIINSSNK